MKNGPTKEEKRARVVAQKLVDAYGEFENFQGDPEMVIDAASTLVPRKSVSPKQLAEIRHQLRRLLNYD
jgi:hypothetical protein